MSDPFQEPVGGMIPFTYEVSTTILGPMVLLRCNLCHENEELSDYEQVGRAWCRSMRPEQEQPGLRNVGRRCQLSSPLLRACRNPPVLLNLSTVMLAAQAASSQTREVSRCLEPSWNTVFAEPSASH